MIKSYSDCWEYTLYTCYHFHFLLSCFYLFNLFLGFFVSKLPIHKTILCDIILLTGTYYHIGFNCSWEFLGVPFSFHSSTHISWSIIAFLVNHQQSRKPISTILSRSERNKMMKRLKIRTNSRDISDMKFIFLCGRILTMK